MERRSGAGGGSCVDDGWAQRGDRSAYLPISAELVRGHLNLLCCHFVCMRLPNQGPFARPLARALLRWTLALEIGEPLAAAAQA